MVAALLVCLRSRPRSAALAAAVTRLTSDYIDFRSRANESGQLTPGFHLVLYEWCRDQQYPLPSLLSKQWVAQLPGGVVFRDEQRCRQVYGLKLHDASELAAGRGSWFSFGFDAITVAVQLNQEPGATRVCFSPDDFL